MGNLSTNTIEGLIGHFGGNLGGLPNNHLKNTQYYYGKNNIN